MNIEKLKSTGLDDADSISLTNTCTLDYSGDGSNADDMTLEEMLAGAFPEDDDVRNGATSNLSDGDNAESDAPNEVQRAPVAASELPELDPFIEPIRQCFNAGYKSLAVGAIQLCFAKAVFRERRNKMRGGGEFTFERWYWRNFGISKDKANRLMNWVRPWMARIDLDNPDDPILRELAAVQPCRGSLANTLGELCMLDVNGVLVIKDISNDNAIVPVRSLSVSGLEAMITRIKKHCTGDNAAEASESVGGNEPLTDGQGPSSDSLAEGDESNAQDEAIDVNFTVDEDSGTDSTATGASTGAADTSEDLEALVNGHVAEPTDIVVEDAVSESEGKNLAAATPRTGLYLVNAQYEDCEQSLYPSPIDSGADAFCVRRTEGGDLVLWWDHVSKRWRECEPKDQVAA